jgi:hypothetical protein
MFTSYLDVGNAKTFIYNDDFAPLYYIYTVGIIYKYIKHIAYNIIAGAI